LIDILRSAIGGVLCREDALPAARRADARRSLLKLNAGARTGKCKSFFCRNGRASFAGEKVVSNNKNIFQLIAETTFL
jgi:hypothetical protein